MEIATPKVYLITRPQIDVGALLSFKEDEKLDSWWPNEPADRSDGEYACEVAGRLCYMSFGKGRKTNKEFISNIITAAHGSVLEHAVYGFIITGVSRSFTHELVRHRHLSFSQLSQRYVDESDAKVVIPDAIKGADDVFTRAVTAAQTAYRVLMSHLENYYKDVADTTQRRKLARQAARCILPNATETKIFVTGNARAWRHFIDMRTSTHADIEIRQVATMILEVLRKEAPSIFDDYEIHANIVTSAHRKV